MIHTSEAASKLFDIHNNSSPEFIRLPKPGSRDPYYGLSRSTWNTLILPSAINGYRPPIRSISLKKRGAVRGVRLIDADAARAYFSQLKAEAVSLGGRE